MARSKAQLTHAKRTRELARLEKRARKQEKKDARKLAASDPTAETETETETETAAATATETESGPDRPTSLPRLP